MAAIAVFLHIFNAPSVWSQNNYPASGDALIHGLTIGTGRSGNTTNTALGDSALYYTKGGINNTAVGMQALMHNSSGTDNTALACDALYSNFSGGFNLAAGFESLFLNNTGSYNVALGGASLGSNTSGYYNTAIGEQTMYGNSTGAGNTACGSDALYYNSSGSYNAVIGDGPLASNTIGNYNTGLGSGDVYQGTNPSNAVGVGYVTTVSASNSVVFSNQNISSIGGYASWTNFSDGRYKKNVNRNVPGLAFINRLEPVTYTLDLSGIESRLEANQRSIKRVNGRLSPDPIENPAMQENSRIVHTGFIAQDVEKAAQSLNYAFSGVDKPKDDQQSFYGLRYSDFVAPLVKALQELSTQNDSLKTANAQLIAELDQIEQLLLINKKN
jgi:trimeric autotransporter adhesin